MTTSAWEFGCPKCEGADARVVYRGVDEDGFPVRLYQCKDCQHRFGTEERIITMDAFFARAYSGNMEARWRYRRKRIVCKVCGETYGGGSYAVHKESPTHRRELANPNAAEVTRRAYRAKV